MNDLEANATSLNALASHPGLVSRTKRFLAVAMVVMFQVSYIFLGKLELSIPESCPH